MRYSLTIRHASIKNRVCVTTTIALSMLLAALSVLVVASDTTFAEDLTPRPSLDLNPEDVVRVQLQAMSVNDADGPDSGIKIAFGFASPANKQQTGPIERFVTIVRNPAYAAMVNNTALEFGETIIENDAALVPVIVTASSGEEFGYIFRLSRQSLADCDGCWMTDSVAPLPPPKEKNDKGKLL